MLRNNYLINNPFRILGCYGNSTTDEIETAYKKMLLMVDEGVIPSSPVDLPQYLGNVERTKEAINSAYQLLQNNDLRFKYALFSPWYNQEDNVLKQLLSQNLDGIQGLPITNAYSRQNKAYAYLLEGDYCNASFETVIVSRCFHGNSVLYNDFNYYNKKDIKDIVLASFVEILQLFPDVTESIIASFSETFEKSADFISRIITIDICILEEKIKELYYKTLYSRFQVIKYLRVDSTILDALTTSICFPLIEAGERFLEESDDLSKYRFSWFYEKVFDNCFKELPLSEDSIKSINNTIATYESIKKNMPGFRQNAALKKAYPIIEVFFSKRQHSIDEIIQFLEQTSIYYLLIRYDNDKGHCFDEFYSDFIVRRILSEIENIIEICNNETSLIKCNAAIWYLEKYKTSKSLKNEELLRIKKSLEDELKKCRVHHIKGKTMEIYDERYYTTDIGIENIDKFHDDYEIYLEDPSKANFRFQRKRPGQRTTFQKLLGIYPIEKKPKEYTKYKGSNSIKDSPYSKPSNLGYAKVGDIYMRTTFHCESVGSLNLRVEDTALCKVVSINDNSISVLILNTGQVVSVRPIDFDQYKKR